MGQTYCLQGELTEARVHLRHAMDLVERVQVDEVTALVDGAGYRVMTYTFLSHVLWLQGEVDEALAVARRAVEIARSHHGAFTLSGSLYFLGWIYGWRREFTALNALNEELHDVTHAHKITAWSSTGEIFGDWHALLTKRHRKRLVKDKLKTVREHIGLRTPFKLGVLSQAVESDDVAAQILDEALELSRLSSEHWSDAELLRQKGERLTRANPQAAQTCLLRARDLAEQQGALSWQLRIATSIARLREAGHLPPSVQSGLREIYECFSEGFTTPDLVEAKTLLTDLERPPDTDV